MNKFICSDHHLDHERILVLGKGRPFDNINQMNEALITNHNAVVKPEDYVIMAGDFIFTNDTVRAEKMVRRFNGHKTFVWGNHDKVLRGNNNFGFQSKVHYTEDDIDDVVNKMSRKLCVFHYPMYSWNKQRRGAWQAYGHCHGSVVPIMDAMFPGTWDIGVDNNDFKPLSYEDLAIKIRTTYKGQAEDRRHKDNVSK